MSALAGILYFNGAPTRPGLIEKLTGAMIRRGPDEQTHRTLGSIALGHCMLRTTPESVEEHQPLISQDKKLILVWDGRLDNRAKLRRDLVAAGSILRNNSDEELVLQSYAQWSEECPKHLLGDFAFAIWDIKRNNLFCARDHVGAKPFYYTSNKEFFAFASEDEALLRLPGVSNQPNEELIANLLVPAFNSFDKRRTWLWDISALLPGQLMVVSANGKTQTNTYWQIEPGDESVYSSDKECQEAFLDVFSEAVRCRMRSTGHIAAMMSGGLDSASIAVMVKRLLPDMPGKEFHTYSAISDHQDSCVESQSINSLTQDLDANAHYVAVPSFHGMVSMEDLIEAAWTKAHPVDNSILLPAMMCLASSHDNHRVMLHGVSGDMTMYTPARYVAFYLRGNQWHRAWKECKDASLNHTSLYGTSPHLLLLLNIWTAYMPVRLKSLINRLRTKGSYLSQKLINPDFAQKLQLAERLRSQGERQSQPLTMGIQQAHARALDNLGDVLGVTGYERIAGQYSIELRDPWADKRVLEFFLHLPLDYKIRDGWTKYLARTAFSPDLDPIVLQRRGKEHLGPHFVARLMDETSDFVSCIMEQSLDKLGDYIDVNAIRTRYKKYKCVGGDALEQDFLYEITTLILWLCRISGKDWHLE